MLTLTELPLPDEAVSDYLIPAGTVVYFANQFWPLECDRIVDLEARGNTNHDNQRRATVPVGTPGIGGQHWFWVKGPLRWQR